MRFVLGVFEGGVWPAVLVLLASWFPQNERARANALWMSCLPISSIIMTPITGWLLTVTDWRMVFFVEGLPPIIWGIVWWFALSDHSNQARWVSPEERNFIESVLASENSTKPANSGFKQALGNRTVWVLIAVYFCCITGFYGYSLWVPSVIKEFKGVTSSGTVGLLSAIPFLFALVAMVFNLAWSDRRGKRQAHIAVAVIIGALSLVAGQLFAHNPTTKMIFLIITCDSIARCDADQNSGPYFVCRIRTKGVSYVPSETCYCEANSIGEEARWLTGMELLRFNRNYRNLWLSSVGSQFGNWFNEVALAQVTLTLTHSPAAMGLVLLCRSLPVVILGPLAGPFIDRFSLRRLMIATDLVRAFFALALSLVVLFHMSWILYVDSALLGMSGVLFGPARNAAVPLTVTSDDLAAANGLESQAGGLLQILGAACGGLISTTLGPIWCFGINAASYLWSAWHVLRCHWHEKHSMRRIHSTYLRSLQAGFRESMHNPVARAVILIGISWGLAGGGYYILIPVLGQQVYHMGGLGIGLLYGIDGVGVLIGGYAVNRYVGNHHHRAVIWYGVAYLTQALFFGVMTQFTAFAWGALMLLFMRIGSGVIIPLDTYMLQRSTCPDVRGRVFALHSSTYGGVMQLSYATVGLALARFGIPAVGMVIAAMSLLCGVSWLAQFGRSEHRSGKTSIAG